MRKFACNRVCIYYTFVHLSGLCVIFELLHAFMGDASKGLAFLLLLSFIWPGSTIGVMSNKPSFLIEHQAALAC